MIAPASRTPHQIRGVKRGKSLIPGVFTQDETLLVITNQNGGITLLNFNPTSFHAKTCASSPCVSQTGLHVAGTGHGDSTHFAHSADLASSSTPYSYYERDGLLVNSLLITSSMTPNAATIARGVYADFVNGSGSYGGVLPAITVGACTSNYTVSWQGGFTVAPNGATGFSLDGGYKWCPSWTPADAIGNTIFIDPITNNPGNHGYQWTGAGGTTTGATEPVWNGAGCTGYSIGSTCSDGTGSWVDLGGVEGQGPGFDIVEYRPDLGYTHVNTRLGKIYRGTGNSAPGGLFTTNDPIACTRTLGAPCGVGVTVNLPDKFTLHNGNSNRNGITFEIPPTGGEGNNSPSDWNWGTLTCQNAGQSVVWAGAYAPGTTYAAKQDVSYTDATNPNPKLVTAYYVSNAGSNTGNTP